MVIGGLKGRNSWPDGMSDTFTMGIMVILGEMLLRLRLIRRMETRAHSSSFDSVVLFLCMFVNDT